MYFRMFVTRKGLQKIRNKLIKNYIYDFETYESAYGYAIEIPRHSLESDELIKNMFKEHFVAMTNHSILIGRLKVKEE